MPVTDAVAGLPRLCNDSIRRSAFHIPCESLLLLFAEYLAEDNATRVLVIHVGGNLQTGVTEGIEWQHGHVEVNKVWLISVDGIEGAVIEICHELL